MTGLALTALRPLALIWLIHAIYAGADAPQIHICFGVLVAIALALPIHTFFVPLRPGPKPLFVAAAALVAGVFWLVIAPIPRANWIEVFKIPSASMYPGLEEGDHFVALKRPWHISRGDVVVYDAAGQTFVKRVVALGGDRIAISAGGTVTLNGEQLPVEPSSEACVFASVSEDQPCERRWETLGATRYEISRSKVYNATEYPQTVVPPGTVFLLGDNRENSHDSRLTGAVPLDRIVGRAGPVVMWR